MKVCYRKKETVMDKVDAAIVKAKDANRVIETIELTYHEFQEFAKLLFKIEGMEPMTERIPPYVWYRGVKVINTGWNNDMDPIKDFKSTTTFPTDFEENPVVKNWKLYLESQKKRELGTDHENYHELYGGSNSGDGTSWGQAFKTIGEAVAKVNQKMGSIPVDEDEAIHWGKSVLDAEREHFKNTLAQEALEAIDEKKVEDGIKLYFDDLLLWTKEHQTSKVLKDIDEQMIYEGDEVACSKCSHYDCVCNEPAEEPVEKKKQRAYMKRVCISCKKLYQPILEDDGDTCPGCARY